MARITILGATGALGTHVTEQAVAANHEVSVLVRTPAKLPADLGGRVTVHQADIAALPHRNSRRSPATRTVSSVRRAW